MTDTKTNGAAYQLYQFVSSIYPAITLIDY